MNKHMVFISITLTHAVLSSGLFVWSYSLGMQRFDSLETESLLEKLLEATWNVLYFPIVHLSRLASSNTFPALWGYIPIFLNSTLWAALLIYGYKKMYVKHD